MLFHPISSYFIPFRMNRTAFEELWENVSTTPWTAPPFPLWEFPLIGHHNEFIDIFHPFPVCIHTSDLRFPLFKVRQNHTKAKNWSAFGNTFTHEYGL